MEHYPCINVYLTSLEIRNNLRAMIQNNHNAVECSVLKSAINLIALMDGEIFKLRTETGWHPASELPPEDGMYIAISLPDMYGDTDVFYAEYRQPYGWCYEIEGHYAKINIQKWCYPPKE